LTGGYSPLGATLVSNCIGTAFLNANRQNGTFFHGHSYTGHALGCAAALANLRVFAQEKTLERINRTTVPLFQAAIRETFDGNPWVKDIRTCGMIAGVEFHDRDGKSFPPEDRVGHRICMAARKHGLMTRPIRDTVTLMPPLTVTADEIRLACRAIAASAAEMGLT
jgi:adenosylmethionine-8-amino-7-oxononanoate aminotransferase